MFYVYRVVLRSTGQFYFGARYKNAVQGRLPEDDLWKTYFTSSTIVKSLIKEHGEGAFDAEIVFETPNKDHCFIAEQLLIRDNIKSQLCLNRRYFDPETNHKIISSLGMAGSNRGKKLSEETKAKMRKPKSPEHRRKISETQLRNGGNGPSAHSEETKKKIGLSTTGKKRTDETKRKIGLRHKGKVCPTSTCPHCNKTGSKGPMTRFHFDNCKQRTDYDDRDNIRLQEADQLS